MYENPLLRLSSFILVTHFLEGNTVYRYFLNQIYIITAVTVSTAGSLKADSTAFLRDNVTPWNGTSWVWTWIIYRARIHDRAYYFFDTLLVSVTLSLHTTIKVGHLKTGGSPLKLSASSWIPIIDQLHPAASNWWIVCHPLQTDECVLNLEGGQMGGISLH